MQHQPDPHDHQARRGDPRGPEALLEEEGTDGGADDDGGLAEAGDGSLVPAPRMPHTAGPTRPADARATPARAQASGSSWTKAAARTVTTRGAVPRAIGYIWPKSPRRNDRISNA